jgi:hypothetical protein
MKNLIFIALISVIFTGCVTNPPRGYSAAPANDICSIIVGATIVADDGTYLGKISNQYDSDSILNEYGSYGSQYSSNSIWNEYGSYGGKYSSSSPFNEYSSSPPNIIKNGQIIGYLTTNQYLGSALNPYVIKSCKFY